MSEIVLIILVCLTLLTIFSLYKIYSKRGLYFALVILNIATFILSFKIVNVLRMNINLGIIPYISVLSIFYIFISKYGNKEIKDILRISTYINVATAILLVIINYYIPALTETISINIKGVFISNYKIIIMYPIIMFLSQYLTIKLYTFVNKIQPNIPICIILTYILTGILYTIIFYMIGYIKVLTIKASIYVGLSTYIIGLVITIINMIFVNNIIKSRQVIK